MNILALAICLQLMPTQHDLSLFMMIDVRGWEPSVADIRRLEFKGLTYSKDGIIVKQATIASK